MTHLGYIIAGWGISLGTLGAYAVSVMRRGRAVSRLVPDDRRRWIDSDG